MKSSVLTSLAELIAPRECAVCGHRLAVDEDCICSSCLRSLPRTGFAAAPYDNVMARQFWVRIPIERCVAFIWHTPQALSSRPIYLLKYYDSPETGRSLGRIEAEELASEGFFDGIDFIIPVPLARRRERERGYNQSVEMAHGIASVTGLAVREDIVVRDTFHKSQTRLTPEERQSNVENAFRLINAAAVAGRHVLLVDDVVTTGATICACGRELAKAGDVKISVMSWGFTQ